MTYINVSFIFYTYGSYSLYTKVSSKKKVAGIY